VCVCVCVCGVVCVCVVCVREWCVCVCMVCVCMCVWKGGGWVGGLKQSWEEIRVSTAKKSLSSHMDTLLG
jgi:hypothetical protein